MTLDDLIDRLVQLRRECPAAADARVNCDGNPEDRIVYDRGEVWIGYEDDEYELAEAFRR